MLLIILIRKILISGYLKANLANFTPPACKPKAYGLEGINHLLSLTLETSILAFGLRKSDTG